MYNNAVVFVVFVFGCLQFCWLCSIRERILWAFVMRSSSQSSPFVRALLDSVAIDFRVLISPCRFKRRRVVRLSACGVRHCTVQRTHTYRIYTHRIRQDARAAEMNGSVYNDPKAVAVAVRCSLRVDTCAISEAVLVSRCLSSTIIRRIYRSLPVRHK